MGANGSSAAPSTESILAAITSPAPLPYDDERWSTLFDEGVVAPDARPEEAKLAALLRDMRRYGERFVANNMSSGNLQRLSLHTCACLLDCAELLTRQKYDDPKEDAEDACHMAVTALLVTRVLLQSFIETLKQDLLAVHLSGWPDDLDPAMFSVPVVGRGVPRALMRALITFVTTVRVTDVSYHVYEEALTMLLTLFSTQMFVSIHEPSLFLDMMLDEGEYFGASTLVATLLRNVVARVAGKPRPREANARGHTTGLLSRLAAYGSRLFLLPIRAIEWLLEAGSRNGTPAVANHSALLLLIIGNCRRVNAYTDAFTQCHDGQAPPPLEPLSPYAFKLDYAQLFDSFGALLDHDPHILLLYFLLHRNAFFRQFVQSRSDLDTLLMPLLRHLYDATGKPTINPQQIYMMLIILLMLSQQDEFGATCQRLLMPEVSWYTEQVLLDISVADVIALVLVRTVMLNLSRLQDGYLHTNCMAILANLSSSFSKLHAHTSQRLFVLMSFLRKRVAHTQSKLTARDAGLAIGTDALEAAPHIVLDTRATAGDTSLSVVTEDDLDGMLALYEQLLGIVFEVMQAVVSHPLTQNTAFIYALLYARDDLHAFAGMPRWASTVEPLLRLLHHFDPLISDATGAPRTTDEVVARIERGVMSVPIAPHAKGGDLKFTYTEQGNAEEFFTPYIFSLVFVHSDCSFNPLRIQLFYPPDLVADATLQAAAAAADAASSSSDPLGLVVDA